MKRLFTALAAAFLLFAPAAQAANSTVSAMTAASAFAGTELLYVVQSAADRKGTPAQMATYVYSLASGDCTISGAGAVVCTKTNGTAFGALATTTPGTGVATAAAANLSAAGGLTSTIASGTAALGTGAITNGTCATAVTVVATNVATTDIVTAGFAADPTATTGYLPTAMLTIVPYPTAGNVNFKVCNLTGSSITPSAVTINWRVTR